jgi:predicted aspartyl protease
MHSCFSCELIGNQLSAKGRGDLGQGSFRRSLNLSLALVFLPAFCLPPVAFAADVDSNGTSTAAATGAAPAGDQEPSLDDIVGKALTAYGGKEALGQVISGSSFFGKKSSPGAPGVAYRHVRKGDRWRTDVETAAATPSAVPTTGGATDGATNTAAPADLAGSQPVTETSAFDGVSGWRAEGSTVLDMPGDRLAFLNEEEQRQPWLLYHWQDPDYKFALRGRTDYKQVPVYAVEVTYKDGRPTTLYLTQSNYLVSGLSYETEIPETETATHAIKTANVSVDYSEYRPTAGAIIPYKMTRFVNNAEVETKELSSVNIGTSIDDTIFYKPTPGTAWHIPKTVTIPFDYSAKEIVIKGRINSTDELDFLLDTGASETIIDRGIAAQQLLSRGSAYQIAGVAGYVNTQSSIVKRLEIGNLILNDVQARILDLSGQSRTLGKRIAGIIGTNVISKFVMCVDYSKPALIIGDIDNYPRPAKAASVPFVQKQAPFVKVSLNGHDDQILLVDTGAAFNHIPTAVAQKYLSGDPANLRHVTEGTGLDGRPIKLGKVVIDSVSIGALPVRKVSFTYPWRPDLSGKEKGSSSSTRAGFFQDTNLGILGNPFWENFIVTVDYKYQRLLLQPNPIVRIRGEIGQTLLAADNQLVLHRDFRLAELNYQKALMLADTASDAREQAILLGRLGNLRRLMAKDLQRPEHAKAAYNYFIRAQELASKIHAQDVEGRVLADWSLLYSDNGQSAEAKETIDRALLLAPQDPNVNVDCAVHLYRNHLYPEMQKYVEKALFLEPSNWQALWYQVKLSENFYDTPKVVATLKEILRFYPWSKVAADKLKSLNMTVPENPTDTIVVPSRKAPAHK